MATAAQVKAQADRELAALWTKLVSRQAAYAAGHGGRYWQGLASHGVVPVDGAVVAADRLNDSPSDQAATWAEALREDAPGALSFALAVDVYDGPQGAGFVATATARVNGKTYRRSRSYGPEGWRTVGWQVNQGIGNAE